MARINDHYQKLAAGYLFPEISRRVARFSEREAGADLIRLGIGDVVLPLPGSVREASRSGEPPGQLSAAAMSAPSPMPSAHTLQRHGRIHWLSSSPQKSR